MRVTPDIIINTEEASDCSLRLRYVVPCKKAQTREEHDHKRADEKDAGPAPAACDASGGAVLDMMRR